MKVSRGLGPCGLGYWTMRGLYGLANAAQSASGGGFMAAACAQRASPKASLGLCQPQRPLRSGAASPWKPRRQEGYVS